MAEFLVRRYPTTYSAKRSEDGDTSGWYDLPRITEITIIPTGRTYKVDEEEPMALAGIMSVFLLLLRSGFFSRVLNNMRI